MTCKREDSFIIEFSKDCKNNRKKDNFKSPLSSEPRSARHMMNVVMGVREYSAGIILWYRIKYSWFRRNSDLAVTSLLFVGRAKSSYGLWLFELHIFYITILFQFFISWTPCDISKISMRSSHISSDYRTGSSSSFPTLFNVSQINLNRKLYYCYRDLNPRLRIGSRSFPLTTTW